MEAFRSSQTGERLSPEDQAIATMRAFAAAVQGPEGHPVTIDLSITTGVKAIVALVRLVSWAWRVP